MGALDVLPGGHMYVDESTSGDYLVMCAVVPSGDVALCRKGMRELLMPGQKSLHMKSEKKRAPQILRAIAGLDPTVAILQARRSKYREDLAAREACIRRLAQEACAARLGVVMLDPIDSMVKRDRSWIMAGARDAGQSVPPFRYDHLKRHEEPLMWIADAVGWAWQRGGEPKKIVTPLVTVIEL